MKRITAGLCRILVLLNCLLIHTAYGAKFPAEIDTGDPYNARMVKILGQYDGDRTGYSLAAGDLNGDGRDDMVIGSYTASNGEGVTYVVFGSADFLSNDTMDMDSYPANVLRIYGKTNLDWSGYSVAVGKINGDAYYDIIIGAPRADPGGGINAGEVYVIFGASNLHTRGTIDLSGSPSGVVRIYGDNPEDWTGYSVAAGNINNDSYDDLIIGAYKADSLERNNSGTTYLIFGSYNFQTRGTIDLSGSSSGVVRIHGETAGDMSGYSVAAGDMDGDNVEDVIIGAYGSRDGRGATYVIPGYADIDTLTVLDIDNPPPELLPADDGIVKIYGHDEDDHSGAAVGAGDMNGDGCDDLIMGAFGGDPPNGSDAGETNVIFGVSSFFNKGIVYLGSLISNMVRVYGRESPEESGIAVSAGDLNNDGCDELIIGAHYASPQGRLYAGTTYIIWGAVDLHDRGLIDLNGTSSDVSRLYGRASEDYSGRAVATGDLNGDGCKDLLIGAYSADPEVRANAGEVYVTGGFQATEVINFSPGVNEFVNRDAQIKVYFNSDLDSLYFDVFASYIGTLTDSLYWDKNWATLVPDTLLAASSYVNVTINGKNVDGESITQKAWTFYTKDDEVPPEYIAHVPAENEINVSPAENIVVTFNNDVKSDSTTAVITGAGGRNIAMAKTWSDSVLTLVNNNSFQLSEAITVSISAGDQYGDRADSTWTFSVRPETNRPYFTVSHPGNPQHLPKDAYFRIFFPLDIDKPTVETLLEGSQSGGISGTWAWSDTVYTFNSSQDYTPGETLNLLITASDIHRNTISDSLFTFTVKPDEIPPSILSRSPEDGEVDVSNVAQIIVEFTEDVVRDSTTIAVTSKNQGSKPINYSWTDYMLTASATSSYQINDTITVTVNAGDAYANRQEYSWSFVVRPEVQPPSFTVVVPFSTSLMSTQDTISLFFPGDVVKSTVETTLVGSLNDPIPGTWEWSDAVYTFTPSPGYTPGYTLTLTVNATDTHKNSIPTTIRTFIVKPDETPPSIKAHYPETNEVNVALDQNSIIHFTHDISPDSTTVEVKSHIRGAFATSKSWLDSTLTLTTTKQFQDNETITITVHAGDPYANRAVYEWSFSTGPELTLSFYEVSVPGVPELMGKLDPITFIVSEKVNRTSVNLSLTGSLSGVLTQSWTSLDSAYIFTPADGYSYGETITLIVNAYDIYQNPIPETLYTFTVKGDETPPAITYRSPAPDSTNVESYTDIVIWFTTDVAVDSTSVTVTGQNQRTITMAESWEDNTLTLVNDNSFQISEVITVTVSAGDVYANRMEESWSFSTRQETNPPYYELIISDNPDLMGTEDTISLIFPSDIDTLNVETVLEGSLSGDVAGQWTWSETTFTFTPSGYELGETLTLTVNASDIHGNAIPETIHTFTVKSDEIPPSIISHSPLTNAVNVNPNADIVIEFTADAAPDSTTVSVSGSIQGAITMQQSWEDSVLTLSPDGLYNLNEVITVSVDAGDIYANRKEDTWSFTIKSEAEPPYFDVVTPFAPGLMRTGDTISLVFPGDIDKQTVEIVLGGSISGDVAGEWAWSDTTYIFTPAGYEPGETLTLTVNAKDINDNIIPETTVTFNVKGDEIPPSVLSHIPLSGEENVHPYEDIVLKFSSDGVPDSTYVSVTGQDLRTITMAQSWDDSSLTLVNDESLQINENITVLVNAGDMYANRLEYSWSFTTRPEINPPYFDLVTPGDPGLMNTSDTITLVFPVDVDKQTVETALAGSVSGAVTGEWVWVNTSLTFTPAGYSPGETLTLTVNASDINFNAIEETILNFVVKGDEIPPSIISYSPGADEINLEPGRDIVIEFSSDVCPDSTMVSVSGSAQGAITMEYLWEWNVLTLLNNNSFRLDEFITVMVYAGDIYANRMSETWSFRTKVDDVPPEPEVVVPGDTDELSINAFISLVFPADIDTSSVVVSLEGSQSGALTGNWAWSDSTYIFTPAEFYKFGENISLTVNAADIYGNTMEEVSRTFTVSEHAPWLNITSVELTDSTTHTYKIDYTFDDPDDSYTMTRGWKYSIDGGEWVDISEDYITNNQTIPPGKGSIYLKLPDEFIGVYSKNVRFRMEVFDGRFGSGYRISPPFAVDVNQKSAVIVQNVIHNLDAQNITVSYNISDEEKNTVSLFFEYSCDYGLTWFTGEPEENVSQIPHNLYNGSFTWNYMERLEKGIDYFGFQVRLTTFDYKPGTPGVSDFVNIDLNEPPSLELDDIFTTQSGDVSLKYHITDAENDTISLVCSYSLDNGSTWIETPNVAGTDSILTYDGSFVWYSKKDTLSISSFVVKFRAVPVDHDEGTGDETEVFQLFNNGPPDVTVTLPDTVGNIVDIPFHISDPENDPVTLHVMWSHGGGTWMPATVTGDTLNIAESTYIDTLVWNSKTDTGSGFFEELLLKVIVTDEHNPLGSSALNFHELSIALDNEAPKISTAWGFAYGDTVYFNFTETVIDSTVFYPDRFTLSHGLSVQDVQKGNAGSQYFLLLGENEKLPFDTVTMTVTDVEDIFGNITDETSVEFFTEDDNENPGVSIQDIPEEVTGDVHIYYQISDAESDIVSLTVSYSFDGGNTWIDASVEGMLNNIDPAKYSGDFLWKTAIDIQDMDVEGVRLKVTAADLQEGAPAISIPFRVDNNVPPSVVMSVADPDSIFSGKMELFYELDDAENDTLGIGVFYSLDDGENYEQAAISGLIKGISPDSYSGKVEWDTETDLSGIFDHVLIKMIPLDNDEGTADSLAVWVDNYGACRVKVTLPEGEQTDDISVVYSITDPNGRDVSLNVEFSTDYGQTWKSAVTDGKISQIGSEQYDGSFTWESAVQLDGYEGIALLRVIPNNGIDGVTETDEVFVDYNDPPVIALEPPPDEVSDDVTIFYTVTDTERDIVSISIEYSIDDGKNWYEAEISGETTGIAADGIKKSIVWQSGNDLPGKEIDNVRIRMSVSDTDPGNTAETGNIHLDNNQTPSVVISVANPDSTYEDYIEVNYILSDPENNMLGFEMLYSTDGGINFLQAKVTGKTSGIFSGGYSSTIRWETLEDLTGYFGEAVIKLLPSDNKAGTPDSLTVRINTIGVSSVALTAPQGEQNDDIQVSYEITDTRNNNVSLAADYSIDEGVTWNSAETVGNITNLPPDSYKGSFVWKAGNDLDGYDGTVRLRVTPDNGAESVPEIAVITVDYNEPPFIEVVLNDTDKVYSGQMAVSFRASDTEKDNLTVNLEYSLDGGETYLKAALSGSAAVTPDVDTEITWLSFGDIGFRNNAKIYLRLTPCDNDPGESYAAGPYTVTNHVGDYTYDLKINGDDLPYFIDIWNNQDTAKEIGPVIGVPPNLSVLPDGKVDFEDLTAFIWMWNWFSDQVSEAGKAVSMSSYYSSDDSGLDSGVRFMPSGDGTFKILSEKRPDFMNVFVMSDKNEKIKITVCESEYWSNGDGVFLTRSYIDGKFEIAGARMGDIGEDSNTPCNLGTLRVNSRTGDILLAYKLRISGEKEMLEGETVLEKDELFKKPAEYALKQNSPNPFNPATAIRYSLPHDVHVTLTVYTVHGQLIEVLKDEFSPAGEYSVRWDASLFANGIYFYTLKAGNFIETRKMMLVK